MVVERNGRTDSVFYYNEQIFFIDTYTHQFCCWHESTKLTSCASTGGIISFAVPVQNQPDKFVVGYNHGDRKRIAYVTWNTRENDHPALKIFNNVDQLVMEDTIIDGTVDMNGVLWFWTTNMHGSRGASVYSYNPFLPPAQKVKKHVLEGNDLSNGIFWCPRVPSRLYYVNAHKNKILLYHYDTKHGIVSGPPRVVFDLTLWASLNRHDISKKHAHIGHATIDNRGFLWVPIFGRAEVLEVDPFAGAVDRYIRIRANRVSACAFGGAGMDILYVSSFGYGYDDFRDIRPNGDEGGAIFAISNLGPGIRGYPTKPFIFPKFLQQ